MTRKTLAIEEATGAYLSIKLFLLFYVFLKRILDYITTLQGLYFKFYYSNVINYYGVIFNLRRKQLEIWFSPQICRQTNAFIDFECI